MTPADMMTRPIALVPALFAALVLPATAAPPANAPASASATTAADRPSPTDVLVGDAGASDRTRPFPVGDKELYFTNIRNGDKVRSPFRVAFAVSGMGVAPVKAGDLAGTGHHHILIDMPLPVDIKAPIPFDKPGETVHQHYKHFGGGETETVLDLPPGKHTLRLLFADHSHIPYYIDSRQVEIEVLPRGQ